MIEPYRNSTSNTRYVIWKEKSNLGPIDVRAEELELFPEDRPKGPVSHMFEAAQRFAAGMNYD